MVSGVVSGTRGCDANSQLTGGELCVGDVFSVAAFDVCRKMLAGRQQRRRDGDLK